MEQEILKVIKERRSVRAYKPEQIKPQELDTVLEAGVWAPSSMGLQSPKMVAVQDAETVRLLSRQNARVLGNDSDPFYGAPTVIVVFSNGDRPTCTEDGSLVMANLMLAAKAVGLGSCWIHRAKQVFESEEGKALKAKWGIPENYVGVAHCVLGYAAEEPAAKPRKDDAVVRV